MPLPRTDQSDTGADAPPSAKRDRVRFSDFVLARAPSGQCSIDVELEFDGRKVHGRAAGLASPLGDLRLSAEASLRALEKFVDGELAFELLGVKHVRAFDANLVIVSVGIRRDAGTRLVGCYLASDDICRGAALAVLNATNRVLGNYINTR